MNSSFNSSLSNQTENASGGGGGWTPSLDALLTNFGQTWLFNSLWFYPSVIVSSLGTIFNIVSLIVFRDKEFDTSLYSYLRVYSLNSMQVCFFGIFLFAANSKRMFPWGNAWWTHAYWLYWYCPVAVTGYVYGTLLDILITLDRISTFNKRVQVFFKYSPRVMALITLGISVIIQFPWYFVFVPASLVVTLDTGHVYEIWYAGQSAFAYSNAGQIVLYIIYGFRDITLMLVMIALNFTSVRYIKTYLSKKSQLLMEPTTVSNMNTNPSVNNNSRRLTFAASRVAPVNDEVSAKNDTGTRTEHTDEASGTNDTRTSKSSKKPMSKKDQISKAEQKATIMCVILCVVSVYEHVILIACNLYPYFNELNSVTFFLYWMASFSFSLKHAMNFPLFMLFNKNFEKCFYKLFSFRS
jgi:hypothetical protein